jgi:uncharacterized paraquat-inducible protein A
VVAVTANLIDCPACQNRVSAAAWKCPGCGHPIRSAGGRAFQYLAALAAALVAIGLLWFVWSAQQSTINGPLHIEPIPPAAK